MRVRFGAVLMAAMSAGVILADGNVPLATFREVMASRDVLECHRALKPLFDKAVTDGSFNDVKKRDAISLMVANHLLYLRIRCDEDAISSRFNAMEKLMWYVTGCNEIAQTNVYFLKIADYLSDVREISVEGREDEIKEAREKDKDLISSGAIEAPIIYTSYPRTPNLLALRRKYDSVDRWNSAVKKHRNAVAICFRRPMARYLSTLRDEEERSQFRRNFTTRAHLAAKECRSFFGDVDVGTRKDTK